jgi:hypothetical protein
MSTPSPASATWAWTSSYGRTTKTGSILAAGIVAGLPIGADGLSSDTWKLGPELLVGQMRKNSVVLLFTNHQWDVSGPAETSLTTFQPILSYLPGGGWSISTAGLIAYNWIAEQWTVPLNLTLSRTLKLGTLPLKLQLEGNYYVERDDALGQRWMIGFNITPVVPNVVAGWLGRK